MKDILLVFLGAALTYIATLTLEKQRHKEAEKESQRAYLLKVRLGLQSLSSSVEKLKDGYSYREFFEFLRIDMVDSQIKDLQTLKSDIEKLSWGRQEKFLTLLNDALLLAGSIRGIENFATSSRSQIGKLDPAFSFPSEDAHRVYFEKQRNQKLIDLIEVKRKIDDFLRGILQY